MRVDSNRSISLAVVIAGPLLFSSFLCAQHSVDYQLQQEWQGGYNADIVLQVDENGPALEGWALSWVGSPEVEYAWNCTASVEDGRTILDAVWYNETIQPGDSVVLGYTGIGSWPPSPGDVRINGELVLVSIDGEGDEGEDGEEGGGGHDDDHDDDHGDDHGQPECCFGDMDGDFIVDGADLSYVLIAWNTADKAADLDRSNLVDGADLAMVLTHWGSCLDHLLRCLRGPHPPEAWWSSNLKGLGLG